MAEIHTKYPEHPSMMTTPPAWETLGHSQYHLPLAPTLSSIKLIHQQSKMSQRSLSEASHSLKVLGSTQVGQELLHRYKTTVK